MKRLFSLLALAVGLHAQVVDIDVDDTNVTKSSIGLADVDNTADLAKPVSTAQAAAIAAAQAHAVQRGNHTGTQTAATISDFATAAAAAAPVQTVAGKSGAVILNKADVGLSSVDNTADSAKPVSTLQAAADAAVQAFAIQRTNHTGTQLAATISDFESAALVLMTWANVSGKPSLEVPLTFTGGLSRATNTISLANTAVTPGSYTNAQITVGADGRITAAANGPAGNRESITQADHDFAVGDVLRRESGVWQRARADSASTTWATGVVESVDGNTFVLVRKGPITLSGLTPGPYYLSDATAGLMVATKPTSQTSYEAVILRALSATEAEVDISIPASLALVEFTDIEQIEGGLVGNNLEGPAHARGLSWAEARAELIPGGTTGQVLKKASNSDGDVTWAAETGGGGPTFSAPASLAGTEVDFAAYSDSQLVLKAITSNTTFTFANLGTNLGKKLRLGVSTTGSPTITWPAAVAWGAAGVPTPSADSTDEYELQAVTATSVWARRLNAGIVSDTTAPELVSAAIGAAGDVLTLGFSETVTVANSAGFTLSSGQSLSYTSGSGSDTLLYGITPAVPAGSDKTLDYTSPGAHAIEDAVGNDLASFSGEAVANGSTFSENVFALDMEAGTLPSGWTNISTPVWNSTSAVFHGVHAIRFWYTRGAAYVLPTPLANHSAYAVVQVTTELTNNPGWARWKDAVGELFRVRIVNSPSGQVRLYRGDGTTVGTTSLAAPIALGEWIHFWVDAEKGTGSDATVRVYISRTAAKPSTADIVWTAGNFTTDLATFEFYGNASGPVVHVDDAMLRSTVIGSNPWGR